MNNIDLRTATALAEMSNPRELIGGNNPPPDSILEVQRAFDGVSAFLADHPVIATQDDAKLAKSYVDGAKEVLKAAEDERDGLVRPFNEHVRSINVEFKTARAPLDKLLSELLARLDRFIAAEEERRQAELAEARRRAAEAERIAREAEAKEREAIDNAEAGEFTDVGGATAEADEAFRDFKHADRDAARAARDAKVRINDGLGGRALSRRTKEDLSIVNWQTAITEIIAERDGVLPEKIAEAILSAARDFRKAKGRLPVGVKAETTRSL